MRDQVFTLIGLTRDSPLHEPFWTRAVPVGAFHAISLAEAKRPDRATLMAICRACCLGMPDFVPVAPTRITRGELADYAADQGEPLRALIGRVGGRQESILTLEWIDRRSPADGCDGREWLPLRALQTRRGPARRGDLAALARRLAAPAASLAQADALNPFDGGCDLSLLHAPDEEEALGQRIGAALRAEASALHAVTAELSGPFPPYSFVELPPYDLRDRQDAPR